MVAMLTSPLFTMRVDMVVAQAGMKFTQEEHHLLFFEGCSLIIKVAVKPQCLETATAPPQAINTLPDMLQKLNHFFFKQYCLLSFDHSPPGKLLVGVRSIFLLRYS